MKKLSKTQIDARIKEFLTQMHSKQSQVVKLRKMRVEEYGESGHLVSAVTTELNRRFYITFTPKEWEILKEKAEKREKEIRQYIKYKIFKSVDK